MNILSGRFRGRRIKTRKDLSYRPTKTIVRKSIFDSISPFKYNFVLDLFSGSGILGFEAASRGAKSITFVENNTSAFKLLKKNSLLFPGAKYQFYRNSVFKFFNNNYSFDLIFADPPYGKYDLLNLSDTILEHLNTNGKFILECERGQRPFMDAKIKDFGTTRLLFWEKL